MSNMSPLLLAWGPLISQCSSRRDQLLGYPFVLAVSETIYIQQELTNEMRVCPQIHTRRVSSLVGTVTNWIGETPLATRGESLFSIKQANLSCIERT